MLQSAVELIAERGEAGLRLADVADRWGMSIGAIQHHFPSRDRLVAEAQLERFIGPAEADIKAIEEMLAAAETDSLSMQGGNGAVLVEYRADPAAGFGATNCVFLVVGDLRALT